MARALTQAPATVADGAAAHARGDFDAALAIFEPLAAAGEIEALAWLGAMHAAGEGVPPSPAEAFKLYLAAAERGHGPAQTNVGAMLVMGQGVPADPPAGVAWLRKAAEGDDAMAQFNYATCLSKGTGAAKDEAEAALWYRRAAERGHYPSQARLGFLHANGIGVEKDRVEAYVWLTLAAQHGVGTALNALEGVIGQMSSDEKQKGAALVQNWRSRTADISRHARLNPVPG